MVNKIPIPEYDNSNPLHVQIKTVSEELHELVAKDDVQDLIEKKEMEINEIVSELLKVQLREPTRITRDRKVGTYVIIPVTMPQTLTPSNILNQAAKETTFNVFDIETTGFSPTAGDRIVEIWVGKYKDGILLNEFLTVVNPERPIPTYVTEYHGISDDVVQGNPTFREVAEELVEFLGTDIIIFHGSEFDLRFLRSELQCSGQIVPLNIVIDTLQLARRQFSFGKNDLNSISSETSCQVSHTHKAKQDGMTTANVFYWMLGQFEQQLGEVTLEQLIGLQGKCIVLKN